MKSIFSSPFIYSLLHLTALQGSDELLIPQGLLLLIYNAFVMGYLFNVLKIGNWRKY